MESCDSPIKSIEIQLVRVETCGCAEGYAKDGKERFCFSYFITFFKTVLLLKMT